jgi:hypothetical protein
LKTFLIRKFPCSWEVETLETPDNNGDHTSVRRVVVLRPR